MPNYLMYDNNVDCQIIYHISKYGYADFLPIPKPIKYLNDEYVFCLPKFPISISNIIIDRFIDDGCSCTFMKTENTELDCFINTQIIETIENINGVITIEHTIEFMK